MEKFQSDEIKNYEVVPLLDYKEYPIKVGNVLGFNNDNTVAVLSDNRYMFRIKDSFLKLGFIKSNQVSIVTFSKLSFLNKEEQLGRLLISSLLMNDFTIKESSCDPAYSETILTKIINGNQLLVIIEEVENTTNIKIILYKGTTTIKLVLELPDSQDLESVYDFFQNLFGLNINTGMSTETYLIRDPLVDRYLNRIEELQADLSDEEFLALLDEHPEFLKLYQKEDFNRENTKKILEVFFAAVAKKKDNEYPAQYAIMTNQIKKMEKELKAAKDKLKFFVEKHKVMSKTIDDLDV